MTSQPAVAEQEYEMIAFPDGTRVLARCGYCRKPAFFLKEMVADGDALHTDNLVQTDGRHARVGEMPKCGSCGAWFATSNIKLTLQERGD